MARNSDRREVEAADPVESPIPAGIGDPAQSPGPGFSEDPDTLDELLEGLDDPDDIADAAAEAAQAALAERNADDLLIRFELELRGGRPWFDALLDCIRDWRLPREQVGEREYVFLIEREAFDWLLLAERLCDAMPEALLPPGELEALLLDETPPLPLSEDEFKRRLGPEKYWAHLNFLYGVRVEQALHLAVERNLLKERGGIAFSHARLELDQDVFGRIYGTRQDVLLREFRAAGNRADTDRMSQSESQAFTYWLFRRRLERQDPARVASDTRLGLDMLLELELARQRRRLRAAERASLVSAEANGAADTNGPTAAGEDGDVIEAVVVAVG